MLQRNPLQRFRQFFFLSGIYDGRIGRSLINPYFPYTRERLKILFQHIRLMNGQKSSAQMNPNPPSDFMFYDKTHLSTLLILAKEN